MLRVIVSKHTNPYVHLAQEHFYLYQDESIEQCPVLFIYCNEPSVILGNFQNPWLEVNLPYCWEKNIKIVRRFSGGGCVYHDEGNINFSYIAPKSTNGRNILLNFLVDFCHQSLLDLNVGEKSDLYFQGKKISGSAFRETKNRMLHHCSFLFNAKLDDLRHSLDSRLAKSAIETRALPSRRSSVINLIYSQTKWNRPQDFIEHFIHYLAQGEMDESSYHEEEQNYTSWDYVYGKTPSFKCIFKNTAIEVVKGCLHQLQTPTTSQVFEIGEYPLGKQDLSGLGHRGFVDLETLNYWNECGIGRKS